MSPSAPNIVLSDTLVTHNTDCTTCVQALHVAVRSLMAAPVLSYLELMYQWHHPIGVLLAGHAPLALMSTSLLVLAVSYAPLTGLQTTSHLWTTSLMTQKGN